MRTTVLLSLILYGCSGRECPPDPVARPRAGEAPVSAVVSRAARLADHLDVLVLSGGGSHGAFGAGLLKGWREATPPRPPFQVVTGVSTGALLATHAFLGRAEDDLVLERVYTTVSDWDIFSARSLVTLPFSTSLTTLEPLESLIAEFVDDRAIDAVAEQAPARALFVATTNMDDGRLKVWDLTALAVAHEYQLYRKILLASSSVPVLHPPVYLNGVHHADGGVREQLLLREVMFALSGARSGATVHVVLNAHLQPEQTCVQPDLVSIALRSVDVLTGATAVGNLYQSKAVADLVGAQWRLARIPEEFWVGFGAQSFDPDGMRRLFNEGVMFGRENLWEATPPDVPDATRYKEGASP